jgi:hypothetical protein
MNAGLCSKCGHYEFWFRENHIICCECGWAEPGKWVPDTTSSASEGEEK